MERRRCDGVSSVVDKRSAHSVERGVRTQMMRQKYFTHRDFCSRDVLRRRRMRCAEHAALRDGGAGGGGGATAGLGSCLTHHPWTVGHVDR